MKINAQLNIITLVLLLLLSSWSLAANARSQSVGKIILAVGEVIATNPEGSERKLRRRSKIYSGDTLSTKSGARCEIRFTDKSLVTLAENSIFMVDEYNFNQSGATKEKAIYSLIKGGMRSISGAIGQKNREDYQLKTPIATIGVRGTTFAIGLIEEEGKLNLYGTVGSGAIVVENEEGDLEIQPGQNFQVQKNLPPKKIRRLPKSFPFYIKEVDDEWGREGTG